MDARELLKTWPGWSNANAETVLTSAAWRMEVVWKDGRAALTRRDEPLSDMLALRVAFDDEEHVLALGDSELFPDLHLLWSRRADLPREVLLALVERECGDVFQMLEGATKRLFAVRGLADGDIAARGVFHLDAGAEAFDFALDLSPALTLTFGERIHLDLAHASIRSLTRPAVPEYAELELDEAECAALAVGDFLLLPEEAACGRWCWERGADGLVHVCGTGVQELSFAQIVDGELPALPPLEDVELVRGERPFARATRARVAAVPALRVVALGN